MAELPMAEFLVSLSHCRCFYKVDIVTLVRNGLPFKCSQGRHVFTLGLVNCSLPFLSGFGDWCIPRPKALEIIAETYLDLKLG